MSTGSGIPPPAGLPRVSVVIAARDEEDRVADTVRAATAVPGVVEVVVVDDGSRDSTSRKAREAGARVVTLPRPSGKGHAMECGLRQTVGDVVVFLDADLGATASWASALVERVAAGSCDMCVARFGATPAWGADPRQPRGAGRQSGGLGFVRWLARTAVRLLAGADVRSAISGQRAMSREAAVRLVPFAPGFGVEVGMTLDALRAGMRLEEVTLPMQHRVTGRDLRGFLHRARQAFDIAAAALARVRREPGRPGPSDERGGRP